MSVTSPKSATKEPINFDAVLICKKEVNTPEIKNPIDEVLTLFNSYIERFESMERKLSSGDRFVIACSQAIAIASMLRLDIYTYCKFVRKVLEMSSKVSQYEDKFSVAF